MKSATLKYYPIIPTSIYKVDIKTNISNFPIVAITLFGTKHKCMGYHEV